MGEIEFPMPSVWLESSPAFDFRSDTVTTPTLAMLQALTSASHGDDGYSDDASTQSLEAHMASLTGKQAGIFVTSGTMGNQVSLRALQTQSPCSILCDHRSHILNSEAGGVAVLCGATVTGVVPSNGVYLTVEDVKKHVVISRNVHSCPTRIISLENTLGGTILPLQEVKKILAFARQHGIKMHLDGARLWEAVAAGAGGLKEYAECFDSLTMCFTKGLGAPFGSIIVGSKEFVKQARWARQMIGGGMRQCGILAAAARVAFEGQFGRDGGRLKDTHERAEEIARAWMEKGGKVRMPVDTNMVWLDLPGAKISKAEFVRLATEAGVRLNGGRVVLHYQISDEAVARLKKVLELVFNPARPASKDNLDDFTDTYGR